MKYSYTRVSCYKNCPMQFKLRYIDELETYPSFDPTNAKILGRAAHTGIEKDIETALAEYFSNYPVIDDVQVNEALKLHNVLERAIPLIPLGEHEVKVEINNYTHVKCEKGARGDWWDGKSTVYECDFNGFIDLLVPKGNNHFDLYDFKYSNNVEGYMQSVQLHVYKHFYELTHKGHKIDNLYYVFLPKTMVRQKKTEDLIQFRERMLEELNKKEVQVIKADFDFKKVGEYLEAVEEIKAATEFPKKESRLCDFCEYKEYCKEGNTSMILPKNERRELGSNKKKVIWLYGAPFSGKTYLTDKFPDPLMLNTDGNIRNVTAAYLPIKDEVTVEGRMTKRKDAWVIFKEIVEELEKKQNDFKTIVVDLIEDVYEHCRVYMYKEMKITHESDAPYKAYDIVRKEFLDVIKRLTNLDYENIILISHEDSTTSFMTMSGASNTKVKPNLADKVANKLSGMVDIVARVVANGDNRKLSFKSNEYIFGGGRLANLKGKEIPLTYDDLMKVYAETQITEESAPARRSVK